MPRAVVEVRELSKRYVLGGRGGGQRTLREALAGLAPTRSGRTEDVRELWALRDVDLTIEEGETLGVVGRNGAGKSTLLKILARITAPTSGVSRVRGRVGALLEVGTGFHSELTGRENIFLNGAILGMRRSDISRSFDEIVEFAGVERFIDTPLKRYSSGMELRLAFAVAAHLEPEVIVVDEVLAVGDAEFQRKCLGRMSELRHEGRTVLFVSHDHGAVARLCPRSIWIEHGAVAADGPTTEILAAYEATAPTVGGTINLPSSAGGELSIVSASVSGLGPGLRRGDPLTFTASFRLQERHPGLDIGFYVKDEAGRWLVNEAWSDRGDVMLPSGAPGDHVVRMSLPAMLGSGVFTLSVWMGTAYETLLDDEVMKFEVEPRLDDDREAAARPRLLSPPVEWSLTNAPMP